MGKRDRGIVVALTVLALSFAAVGSDFLMRRNSGDHYTLYPLTIGDHVCVNCRNATSTLEVNGSIRVGSNLSAPQAGFIRWSGTDFEGYNGTHWVSFTT